MGVRVLDKRRKPAPWTVEQSRVGLEYSKLLGEALQLFTLDNSPRDIAGGEAGVIQSGGFSVRDNGRGFETGQIDFTDRLQNTTKGSVLAVFHLDAVPTGNWGIVSAINGAERGWCLQADNNTVPSSVTNTFSWRVDITGTAGGPDQIDAPAGTATVGLHAALGSFDASGDISLAVDGVEHVRQAATATDFEGSGVDLAQIGLGDDGFLSTAALDGVIYTVAIWDRAMNTAESELLTDLSNPFGLVRPVTQTVAMLSAAASGSTLGGLVGSNTGLIG